MRAGSLAHVLREAVLALPPESAAVLCLRHGLAGDRPRRPDEVARLLGTDLGMDLAAVRTLEADGLAALRGPNGPDRPDRPDQVQRLRDVLDAAVASSPRAYP